MAGGKFCLNRRHGITRAEHEAEVARRKRQHGRRGQAKSEQETTASDAHTSSLSRWPASVLTDCRKAILTSILSPPTPMPSLPLARASLPAGETGRGGLLSHMARKKALPSPIGRRSG